MTYNDLMKVSKYLRSIDGYSYITTGALVVEGTALQLDSMVDFMELNFTGFEFVDIFETYLVSSDEVKEMLTNKIRDEKIDKIINND